MTREGRIELGVFALVWVALTAYGVWVRQQIPLDALGAVHGWDYNGLGRLLSDHRSLSYIRFRHPLWGFFLAPIPLLLERVAQLDYMLFWGCLAFVFSGFVTAGIWLVYRVCASLDGVGRVRAALCTAGFACFAYVRYMATGPESYPLSMPLAVGTLLWVLRTERRPVDLRLDTAVWGALFFFAGGTTLTQGVKVVLAYLVSHRLSRRVWGWLVGGGAALLAAGALFYVVKLVVLGDGTRTVGAAFRELWAVVPQGIGWGERLRMLEMFFCEPIVPHGVPFTVSKIVQGYASAGPYVVCGAVYALAAFGAWRLRRTRLLRAMAAMFAVDALIHLAFFWGMEEAQIFCPHWFYALPILWAGAVGRRTRLCYNGASA